MFFTYNNTRQKDKISTSHPRILQKSVSLLTKTLLLFMEWSQVNQDQLVSSSLFFFFILKRGLECKRATHTVVLQWSLTSFPPANAANSVMNTGVLPRWGTCRALWKAPADWHLESSWWQGHFWVACSTSVSGWRGPECAWSHKHNFNLRRAKQTQGSLDKDPPPLTYISKDMNQILADVRSLIQLKNHS